MSSNLVLGRGEVYFDRYDPVTGLVAGERYLGATPNLTVSAETQELEHFSAERGLRVKDESVTLSIDITGTVTIEDMSPENLALFFFGTSETATIASATGVTEDIVAKTGHYYQLGMTTAKQEGVENVTSVAVVLEPAGANTTLTVDVDYTVDLALGRVYIMPGGAVTDGANVRITYNRSAQTQARVLSGSTLIQGAMRFISYNGVGTQRNFYMPKVTLRPNGEFALKGDEWQNLALNMEILQPGDALSALIASGRGVV